MLYRFLFAGMSIIVVTGEVQGCIHRYEYYWHVGVKYRVVFRGTSTQYHRCDGVRY